MLREEAEQRLGSAEKVDRAIEEKRAYTRIHKGVEMVYLPTNVVGMREEFGSEHKLERKKETTDAVFNKVAETMRSLKWTIQTDDSTLSVSIHR